jgi:hypothetical protein
MRSPCPNPSGSDEMGSADWTTTSNVLDALRDEIAKDYSSKTVKVENAIIEALSLKANYNYKNNRPELWIQGIQKFQEKTNNYNYSAYGFITMNDPTYNLLKCEVAKNLKIILKSPPAECSQNS